MRSSHMDLGHPSGILDDVSRIWAFRAHPACRCIRRIHHCHPHPIQSYSARALRPRLAGLRPDGHGKDGRFRAAHFAPAYARRKSAARPRTRIRVLVLTPTRELAAQIGESFETYGYNTPLRQTVVFGGVGQNPQTRAIKHGVDILVATPGRLIDLMNQGYIDLGSVETFVLDEADRMLDMGFLPDVRHIISKLPKQRQTLLFSATMPEAIERLRRRNTQRSGPTAHCTGQGNFGTHRAFGVFRASKAEDPAPGEPHQDARLCHPRVGFHAPPSTAPTAWRGN